VSKVNFAKRIQCFLTLNRSAAKPTTPIWRAAMLAVLAGVSLVPLRLIATVPAQAAAGTNQQINFQARLLNSQGATVPDGNYNVEFKIYQDGDGVLGGGDETLKWTETRLNNNSQGVTVKNGYFSVNLGAVTSFGSSIDWNQDTLWLSLNIGNTNATCTPFSGCGPDGEMTPFKRFASNPYAMNSGQLGGLTSSQFVQLAQGLQVDSSTANASIAINKTGATANILTLQRGGLDVLLLDNSGTALLRPQTDSVTALQVKDRTNNVTVLDVDTVNQRVGIGTAVPADTLDVNGIVRVSTLGTASNDTVVCRNGSNQLASCNSTFATTANAFLQGGNSFTATAVLGTNDDYGLTLETNNTARITVTNAGNTTITGGTTGDALTVNNSTSTGNIVVFQDNGTAVFTIADGGNVTATGSVIANGFIANTHRSANTSTASTNSTAVTFRSGNATGITSNSGDVMLTSGTATSNSGNISIDSGTATGTAGNISIGTGAYAHNTTIGNSTGTSALTLQAGTGNLSITTQGTGTLGIGNNAVDQNIAVGNTVGATTLTLQAGTGGIVLGSISTADNASYICRNGSNQLATCATSGTGAAFIQGGNTVTANTDLGLNSNFDLNVRTNSLTRLTVQADGDLAVDTDTLFVDATANEVGIGTTNPQAKLSLGSDVTAQKLLLYDSGFARYGFGIQNSELRMFAPNSGNAHISFGSISDGNGTTWSEKLRVKTANLITTGDAGLLGTFTAAGNTASDIFYGNKLTVTNSQVTNANTLYGSHISFTDGGTLANTVIGLHVDATTANANDTTYAATFQGGNVGIGTAAPDSSLHINKTGAAELRLTSDASWPLILKQTNANLFSITNGGAERLTMDHNGAISLLPASSQTSAFNIQTQDTSLQLLNVDAANRLIVNNGTTAAGNELENPGFESLCNGWDAACSSTTTNARSGNRAATQSGVADSLALKYIRVEPGQQLYYEGYVRTGSAGSGTGGFYLECRDKDYLNPSFSTGDTWTAPGTSYVLRSNTYTVPAGKPYCRMATTTRTGNTDTWYFDDLYLKRVTEQAPQTFKNSVDSVAAFQVQNASGASLVQASTDTSGSSLLVSATAGSAQKTLVVNNSTSTGNILEVQDNGTAVLTVADGGLISFTALGTAGTDTVVCRNGSNQLASCNSTFATTANAFLQGGNSFTATAVLGTNDANNLELETAGITRLTLDQSGNATLTGNLTVQGTGTSSFAGDVTIAAQKTIRVIGGTNAQRPAGTAGQIYFDTDTGQLQVYGDGVWQNMSRSSTKVVAASNSQTKAGADYIADGEAVAGTGTIDGDQVQINQAITALPAGGGIVYLMEGTYTVDAPVSVPSNVTLAGAGAASIIKLTNTGASGANLNAIQNSDRDASAPYDNRITIRDLKLDGSSSTNTSGTQNGIDFLRVGQGNGTTATPGAKVSNLWADNFRTYGYRIVSSANNTLTNNTAFSNLAGFSLSSSSNNQLTGNISQGNTYGYYIFGSTLNTFTGNLAQGNTDYGFTFTDSSSSNSITGNTSQGNGTYGFQLLNSSSHNTLSGNTIQDNTSNNIYILSSHNSVVGNTIKGGDAGVYVSSTSNAQITNNKIFDTGGSTDNDGIFIADSDNNTITGNVIIDTSCTSTCDAIVISSSTSDNNYLASNQFSGGASSINDSGIGTIYGGQLTGENDFLLQQASGVGIGTSVVDAKLAIKANSGGSQKALLVDGSSSTGNTLEVQDGATAVFVVADGGLVGVGTGDTAPSGKLEVKANGGGTQKTLVVNNSTSTGNILEVQDNGTAVLTVADGGNIVATGNISTSGNISTTGSSTITSAGAITAPTSTNTINGLIINAGALSGITSISASGNISTSGNIFTTGTGSITSAGALTVQGGNLSFSGTTARSIIGPGTGGLTVGVTAGPLTLATTTSGTLAVSSAGALNLTGAAASSWDIGNNTLSLQATNNGAITTGTGLWTQGGNLTFSGTSARTITGPSTGGLVMTVASGPLTISTTTSGTLSVTSAGAFTMTAAANSTWSTSGSAALTLQSGSGTLSLGTTTSLTATGALTVDSGSTTSLGLGTGANAKTITIGNTTGATGIVINTGTADVTTNLLAGAQAIFQATAVPTADLVHITTNGNNPTSAGVNGLQVTYAGGAAAVEAAAQRIDLTPGGTSGGTWSGLRVVGGTAASGVTQNAVKFDNIAAGAGTENAIYVGTGWDRALITSSNPLASATVSQIQLGAPISGGSANGTFIGSNPAAFTGDFLNFQLGGAARFKVDSAGTISSGASAGVGRGCLGGQTLNGFTSVGGIVTGGTCTNNLTDIAEQYDSVEQLEPGDVVANDPDRYPNVLKTAHAYQNNAMGIISTAPYRTLGDANPGYPVALIGRVPTKVSLESGVIRPGDMVTAASAPGYAMKAIKAGMVLGMALEAFDGSEPSKKINVFVNPKWWTPGIEGIQGGSVSFEGLNVSGISRLAELVVAGTAVFEGEIAVAGHVTSIGPKVSAKALTAAGEGATVEVKGSDTAGTVTVKTGRNPGKGALAKIKFNKPYGVVPQVVLTAAGPESSDLKYYYRAATTDFDLGSSIIPQPNTTYAYSYFVTQTKLPQN
jgi:parallel beta-helix repeat protein